MRVRLRSSLKSRSREAVCYCALLTFLAFRKGEINCDLGVDFYRFSIQEIRPVAPLLYCFDRGLREHWQAAFDSNIPYGAILGDNGQQHYLPFNPGPPSLGRICRRNIVDQIRLGYPGGDTISSTLSTCSRARAHCACH